MIKEIKNYIPQNVVSNKNRARSWLYGYNKKYDLIIISKSGQLGKIVEISNLNRFT